jgi:hypothetical protein
VGCCQQSSMERATIPIDSVFMIMLKVSLMYGLLNCLWLRLGSRLKSAFARIPYVGDE